MKKVFWVIIFILASFGTSIIGVMIGGALQGSASGTSDAAVAMYSIIGFLLPSVGAIILGVMWIDDLKNDINSKRQEKK